MLENRKIKWGVTGCISFLLMILLTSISVFAQQTGQITLTMEKNYENQVGMTAYVLADYAGEGNFVYREEFQDSGVDFAQIDWEDSGKVKEIAEILGNYARQKGMQGTEVLVNSEKKIIFSDIQPAYYVIAQTKGFDYTEVQPVLVPLPYHDINGNLCYEVEASPKDEFPGGAVIVNKVDDSEAKNPVAKAVFSLQQKMVVEDGYDIPEGVEIIEENGTRYYWIEVEADKKWISNANGQIAISDLPAGDYRLAETEYPAGFVKKSMIYPFSITKAGEIAEVDGWYQSDSDNPGKAENITIENKRITVTIRKIDDSAAKTQIPGAQLVLKDAATGEVIKNEDGYAKYMFTTKDEAEILKQIPAGDYILSEVSSPDGYEKADDLAVHVSAEADADNTFTMVDPAKPQKEELDKKGKLTVTKRLMYSADGNIKLPIAASFVQFYVALFSDEDCTDRVSNVKTMTFEDTHICSVVFDNLSLNKDYYVAETDPYGAAISAGVESGIDFYTNFADGQKITMSESNKTQTVDFENLYSDLPNEYYFSGELAVSKKVEKDGEALDITATFYAAIFEDEGLTQRCMSVPVLKLEMKESGEAISAPVSLYVGNTIDSVKTYYIAETDVDGNPIEGGKSFGYEVHVTDPEINFSADHIVQDAGIVNDVIADYNGSIQVNKKLTDMDDLDLYASEGEFYAAVFEDKDCSMMVGEPEKITFNGQHESTATFSGLEVNKTYYVAETDKEGNVIETGTVEDVYLYTPVFPNGNEAELVEKVPQAAIDLKNVFIDVPNGYYYLGNIDITKKLLKNGEPYNSDETFYAAVFLDKELKERYDENVLRLDMNGGYEAACQVKVYVDAQTDASDTVYYIAETDKNGNPVQSGESFGYEVSFDHNEVVMNKEALNASVEITNTVLIKKDEEDGTSTSTDPNSYTYGSGNEVSAVKTGDDTPIWLYVILLAAASVAFTGLAVRYIRRRK